MKKALTLAEVLITMGIIGVVMAMTLPALIGKMQDLQHIAMWKKKYSEIANIYQAVKSEMDGYICVSTKTDDKTTLLKCNKPGTWAAGNYTTLSPEFIDRFVSHLKVIDHCGKSPYETNNECKESNRRWVGICDPYYSFYGSLQLDAGKSTHSPVSCKNSTGVTPWDFDNKAVLLEDGSVIYFGGYATGWISVDVNSFSRGPNQIGRDVFMVMVTEDWIKPLGADGTYNKQNNGGECKCTKTQGLASAQGFLGSSDLLNGQAISGACCSAQYLLK